MKREITRRLQSVAAPKILGDASIAEKMKIVRCAGIGCCGGNGQDGFADDKSPEKTETKTALPFDQGDAGFETAA